ncbi:MAG: CAP domain-containing protein [Lachnospiraceae bacterium]|nr:CAP domain-containing protein [Lachnospiraceae bacterium]
MKRNGFRMISIIMVFVMALCLSACGQEKESERKDKETTPASTENRTYITGEITSDPTAVPTSEPTSTPTTAPTAEPTVEPTATPVPTATTEPTPTEEPVQNDLTTEGIINMLKNGEITDLGQFKAIVAPEIARICDIPATCQTDLKTCDVKYDAANPYDVTWDRGADYDAWVDFIDWTMADHAVNTGLDPHNIGFDVKAYKEIYPMLALQYNNDEDLLFRHFVTVGIFEGRFVNNEGYATDILYDVISGYDATTFADDGYLMNKLYAGCYMCVLLYDSYVKPLNNERFKEVVKGYVAEPMLTKLQKDELDRVNEYRKDVGAANVQFNAELAAFANWRARYNAENGLTGHEWAINNNPELEKYCIDIHPDYYFYGENTVSDINYSGNYASMYANSEAHYKTMVDTKYQFTGISNLYNGQLVSSQFDIYLGT